MAKTPLLVPAERVFEVRRRCVDEGLPDPGTICVTQALAFWESASPGNGLSITTALERLYAIGTRLPLAPAQPVLDSVTADTLDWLGVKQHVAVGHLGDAHRAISMQLGEVAGVTLKVLLEKRAQDELNGLIGTWLAMRLPELVWDSLEHRLWVGVERHFSDDERSSAYGLIHEALSATLTCVVSAVIAGWNIECGLLVDLWLAGNWPVGCSADGALVVYTLGIADDFPVPDVGARQSTQY